MKIRRSLRSGGGAIKVAGAKGVAGVVMQKTPAPAAAKVVEKECPPAPDCPPGDCVRDAITSQWIHNSDSLPFVYEYFGDYVSVSFNTQYDYYLTPFLYGCVCDPALPIERVPQVCCSDITWSVTTSGAHDFDYHIVQGMIIIDYIELTGSLGGTLVATPTVCGETMQALTLYVSPA